MAEALDVQASNFAWSEDKWAQIGIDAAYETALQTQRTRAWLLSPPSAKVLTVSRALTANCQSSPTPLVPPSTAMVLESAVQGALETRTPWMQGQFDRVLHDLIAETGSETRGQI